VRLHIGDFPEAGDIEQTDFPAVEIDQSIQLEFTEEADNRFGGSSHHIGHFLPRQGYLEDLFIIHGKGIHQYQQDFGQPFPHGFLCDIGNEIIGFAELAAGELHEQHGKGGIFPDQLEQVFRGYEAEYRILDYFGRGAGQFLAQHGTETDDIPDFRKADDLFLAVDSGFVNFYDTGLNAVKTIDAVALMVDDVAALIQAATFSIMDGIKLVRGQVLEDRMTLDDALITNRNMWDAFHSRKYKKIRYADYKYVA